MSQTIEEWYHSLPMYTKIMGTGMFASTLAYTMGVLNPYHVLFNGPKVAQLQLWRLITDFFFIGKFSFPFIMDLMFLCQFGTKLENNEIFTGANASSGSFLFFLIFEMITLLIVGLITDFPNGSSMNGRALIFAIIYYWSRREPYEQLSMYGFRIPASSLPFAMMLFDLVLGGGIWTDLLGIVSGHLYYFVFEIVPEQYNVNQNFKVPRFINVAHEYIKFGLSKISTPDLSGTGSGYSVRPARDSGSRGNTRSNEESTVRQRQTYSGTGQRLGSSTD